MLADLDARERALLKIVALAGMSAAQLDTIYRDGLFSRDYLVRVRWASAVCSAPPLGWPRALGCRGRWWPVDAGEFNEGERQRCFNKRNPEYCIFAAGRPYLFISFSLFVASFFVRRLMWN